MPIYAYRCDACGHSLEKLQKISDAPLADCPACGKPALVKQVTAAGFQLKGTGWYVTDFRGGSSGAGNKTEAGSGEKASTGSEAKSDKPASDAKSSSEAKSSTSDSKPAAPTTTGSGGGDKKAA
jgi:putative FmdB family regulatory protein